MAEPTGKFGRPPAGTREFWESFAGQNPCSACGTATFWKDYWNIGNFSGEGEYKTADGTLFIIYKSERIPTPKDYDEAKAHDSVRKYAYGQMFWGVIYGGPGTQTV